MTLGIAVWLIKLLSPADQADSLLGDLFEEFSQVSAASGLGAARRWYWRQTLKTVAHLMASGFRTAPWSTVAAVIAGWLLSPYAFALPRLAMEAYVERYADYPSWLMDATQVLRVLANIVVGALIAMALKGREMTATTALFLVRITLGIVASLVWVGRPGPAGYFWTLPWVFAFALANVVGGAIVRTHRSRTLHHT